MIRSCVPRSCLTFYLSMFGLAGPQLTAQTNSAQVSGIISDPDGAAVPGALVSLVNVETGLERSATSSETGNYTVALLPPGSYRMQVTNAAILE